MIKIIINLFIFFIISSCANKHNNSMQNLNESFFKWHKKYSEDLFNTFLMDSTAYEKQFIGESLYRDMKKFRIELKQINSRKLFDNQKNDYFLLDRYLNRNIFKYEKIKEKEWNLVKILEEIKIGILYLLILNEHSEISEEDFNNKVNFISLKINNIPETIKYRHSDNSYVEIIDYLLNEINKSINLSNIKILKDNLTNLESWYKQNYNKFDLFIQSNLKSNYEKYLSIQLEENLDVDLTIKHAEKLIRNYKNNIFTLSLPIYLSNNDEPVWTDYQDTLNIINWMTNNLNNLNRSISDCFNEKNMLTLSNEFLSATLDINEEKLIENIYFKSSSITDKSFFLYDQNNNSFIALNYTQETNPIKLYFNILDGLVPGDLFINYSIKTSPSLINKVYIHPGYSYPYKNLMIKNYIDFFLSDFNSTEDSKLPCSNEYENYAYMLDLEFNINRIKNCISTISTLNYHYYDISIDNSMEDYAYLDFFNEDEIKELKIEIFGFGMDSIIKFKSYNLAFNLFQESLLNNSPKYLIKVLEDNPNISLTEIKNIIK